MTTLLDHLRGAKGQRYTVDDYAGWLKQFTYNGITYPLTGVNQTYDTDEPREFSDSFSQYVMGGLKANPVVWSCSLMRLQVFSQPRFAYQRLNDGRPGELFGSANLSILERPWLHGTTADLLARAEFDVTAAGNFYAAKVAGELVRMRPDWVEIVLDKRMISGGQIGWKRMGYVYYEGGRLSNRSNGVLLTNNEVLHFAPYPDPEATFRGMSWLTPAIREVMNDREATSHKLKFWANAATPNMVVKTDPAVIDTIKKFRDFVEAMEESHAGVENAYRTLYLAGGADATVVGSDFQSMDLRAIQGLTETRIAASAGTHPVVVGLSEGMQGSALNAGNYAVAKRRFADTTMHHAWSAFCASAEHVAPPPPGSPARLWFDKDGVPFLRDDATDEAEILSAHANTIRTLTDGGYEPTSILAAVKANDVGLLVHTGKLSVQLQEPGETLNEDAPPSKDDDDE